ncbi:ABC transporter permease [Alkalicoccus chagannorensis]|uniref:ABC transporter permease n=1 Tax=Alkalicoccus chagannorensis TaxID=427072 RepID=UPI0004249564|nr:ABC transporter permease [Alkalicoccus chagannorensis]
MSISWKRTYAVALKDMKEVTRNLFILSTLITPFLFALIFGREADVPLVIHFMIINITFATVTCFVQMALLAEEKERKTLRSLMLSPASGTEIMLGKSAVASAITLLTLVICLQLTGYMPDAPVIYAGLVLSLLFYLLLGMILALFTKSLIEASVLVMPVIFLLGMGNLFFELVEDYSFAFLLEYLPNFQLEYLAAAAGNGESGLLHLGGVAAWTVAAAGCALILYRKRTYLDQ